METRAHHILIGAFVLIFVAAIFGFVIWLSKGSGDQNVGYYQIHFTDSVAGLGIGGDVRFNGIKVGSVDRIAIDPENPNQVSVTVAIRAYAPIREDSTATMQIQGVTGVSFVQITGGSRDAKLITPGYSLPYPVIRSRPSQISELVDAMPRILDRSAQLLDRGNALLDEENRRNVAAALADFRAVTQMMAERAQSLGRTVDNFTAASEELVQIARKTNRAVDDISATMSVARGALTGLDQLLDGEARTAIGAIGRLASDVSRLVGANSEPIGTFTEEGLTEFRRFIEEARLLVQNLGRVAAKLEENPSQVFFGSKESEFNPRGTSR